MASSETRTRAIAGVVVVALVGVVVLCWVLFGVHNVTDGRPATSCATEADTFLTAVNAYTHATGHRPAETTAHEVMAALAGRYFARDARAEFADDTAPPARGKWSYDPATGAVVKGAHCDDAGR